MISTSSISHQVNININGKEYHSFAEVPQEFRHLIQDDDANGIPDFADNLIRQVKPIKPSTQTPTPITSAQTAPNPLPKPSLTPQESRLKWFILAIGVIIFLAFILLKP